MERRSAKGRQGAPLSRTRGEHVKAVSQAKKDRRVAARMGTHENAALSISNVRYVVETRNVSAVGAQICVRRGVVPPNGQIVTLQFVGRDPIRAKVVWAREKIVGLKFLEAFLELPDALNFEDLGADYFRAILRFQRSAE